MKRPEKFILTFEQSNNPSKAPCLSNKPFYPINLFLLFFFLSFLSLSLTFLSFYPINPTIFSLFCPLFSQSNACVQRCQTRFVEKAAAQRVHFLWSDTVGVPIPTHPTHCCPKRQKHCKTAKLP